MKQFVALSRQSPAAGENRPLGNARNTASMPDNANVSIRSGIQDVIVLKSAISIPVVRANSHGAADSRESIGFFFLILDERLMAAGRAGRDVALGLVVPTDACVAEASTTLGALILHAGIAKLLVKKGVHDFALPSGCFQLRPAKTKDGALFAAAPRGPCRRKKDNPLQELHESKQTDAMPAPRQAAGDGPSESAKTDERRKRTVEIENAHYGIRRVSR